MLDIIVATGALSVGWQQFITILLLTFGLFLILAGVFTAYFGSGKSRTIGVALLVVGLLVGVVMLYYYHASWGFNSSVTDLILQTLFVIVAAVIGALIAIGIFLVAIMKS
ncbi:MAG: hypothetical protein ACREDK_03565 [Thermoplasmata archaeon]